MRRFVKLLVIFGVVVGVGVGFKLWAQTIPGHKTDEKDLLRFYVLAEKRGLDVTCSKLVSMEQINQRRGDLDRERAETIRNNTALNKDIIDLRKKIPGLKALKGLKKTEEDKAQVQKEIDDIEASIKAKQAQMKPPVEYVVSRAFSKSEDADAYINQVEAEAAAAKARAAKEKS